MPYADKERQARYQRTWYRKRKNVIKLYLLGRECNRCGTSDIRVLRFHHRDPDAKEFNVGAGVSVSRKRLHNEIEKCDILCANCHAIEHFSL